MSKSSSSIPGVNTMTDTIDFVKTLWGGMQIPGMNIPGMVMPTLSVDEINKQIKDLKAVESWLALNMNMLQGTIKALEVQSATLSTLESMSASFTAAMQPGAASQSDSKANSKADGKPGNKPDAGEKSPFASPFASPFESPFSFAMPQAKAVPSEEPVDVATAPQAAPPENAGSASVDPAAAVPLANPAAWWNMLQDQFKQAVSTAAAMTPEMPEAAPAAAHAAKSESVTKPKKTASKAPPTPRKRKTAPKA